MSEALLMEYERIEKKSQGGGFSPAKLRSMLLGVEKKRKEEEDDDDDEELESRFYLKSEVGGIENDQGVVGTLEECKDVDIVLSELPDCSSSSMGGNDRRFKEHVMNNTSRIRTQDDYDSGYDSAVSSSQNFEFQKTDRLSGAPHRVSLPPFRQNAPSKWDDAQKWIASPTSSRQKSGQTQVQSGQIAGVRRSAFFGYGNRQTATKVVVEVPDQRIVVASEEPDTKRMDPSQQFKREVGGQKSVNWVPDQYPVPELYSKSALVIESSIADSAREMMALGEELFSYVDPFWESFVAGFEERSTIFFQLLILGVNGHRDVGDNIIHPHLGTTSGYGELRGRIQSLKTVSLSRHDSTVSIHSSTTYVPPPSTVRSVSMRDMGTEMTPIASQEPSRNGTPVRATTPMRSPTSSRPSTPGRAAPVSSPAGTADCQIEPNKSELSDKEIKKKTRREIIALGTQLGKTNIAAWASKEDDVKDTSTSLKTISVDQPPNNAMVTRAAAWEEAEKAKYMARYKREEIKIQAWENHQKAKAEAERKKIEVKVERMRASAEEKQMNKVAATRNKAEEKRARAEANRNCQASKTEQQAEYIRRTGRIPSSFTCCFLFSLSNWCS
ncbi:hypothetical protein GIB67_035921 [Kingdonia uniflora]|uniref:Remorin C-terminal domain-containing protein n=1 Tax=Kingdonia uniflora TaxID=39325 RepID=A0A7J7N120_9MAGN|nr:hypothetical protein GIB67_035921 [Kingdonia uniflora]